jgi:FkbM family methyltransferase
MQKYSQLSPIILFTYNRPWHTQQTLEALEKNDLAQESILYIYADGAKENANEEQLHKIEEVRKLIKQDWKFKEIHIIERAENWGLADNIVDGVTKIVNEYGKIIVLEDDIVTSVGFLKYMNDALDLYEHEEKVMHISGYMFPVKEKLPETFFYNTASCWSWATWKRAWKYFDNNAQKLQSQIAEQNLIDKFNIENTYGFYEHLKANAMGTMKTWAVRWYASFFLQDGHALHPYPSLTRNIGHDGMGENCGINTNFDWTSLAEFIPVNKIPLEENIKVRESMRVFNKNLLVANTSKKNSLRQVVRENMAKIIPKSLKHQYRLKKYPEYKANFEQEQEFGRIQQIPRYQLGTTHILGKTLKFIDSASFGFIYDEMFKKEIYKFTTENPQPYIIDAGANIGLSILYFKQLYPNAQIVAFEPDNQVFEVLDFNVKSFSLTNVELVKKALWNEETVLEFMSEGADGGRVAITSDKTKLIQVPTERLRKYLDRKVDFLKIDIEGAETTVLKDCADLLPNVERLFVEYHSFVDKPQELHQLLIFLANAGFRYNVQHIGVFSENPLTKINNYLGMDNQLNIFAVKEH